MKLKKNCLITILLLLLVMIQPVVGAQNPVRLETVKITASGDDGNLPANVMDNDLNTRWSANGDGQWISFDLGSVKTIGYLGLAFHQGDQRATKFDIEISMDNSSWVKLYSGVSSGKTLAPEAVVLNNAVARYLRIVGHGNSKNAWNSLTEVQIYAPNPAGAILEKIEVAPKEIPVAVTYTKPGLFNPDGSVHALHKPNPVTGRTLNVIEYGADPQNNAKDDRPAIQKAIDAAVPGDEIYFPKGIYNLNSVYERDKTAHLRLKSGVNLRGANEAETMVVSNFSAEDNKKLSTSALRALGVHDIVIANLTVTSTFNGKYSTNSNLNNPEAGGPVNGIHIEDLLGVPSFNITVSQVTVEKYQRIGVRISKSHDIIVQKSTFKNATDVGGGGAGYGVTIQGEGHDINRIGYQNDCRFNVVQECNFTGPYIRHGTLIQYYAHNNLVQKNTYVKTVLDAIDLHGEDEYFNEISNNRIQDVPTGGAIGVGNTGATHDMSGPFNYIHDNLVGNCREGISIIQGSANTIVENNTITGCNVERGKGIYLSNAPGTMIRGNKIYVNKAPGFWGIVVNDTSATSLNIQIIGNAIHNNTNGLLIESGSGIIVKDNQLQENLESNYQSKVTVSEQPIPIKIASFSFVPEKQQELKPEPAVPAAVSITELKILPSDDSFIEAGQPDKNFGSESIIRVKSNDSASVIRIAYLKFKIENVAAMNKVTFQITGRLSEKNPDGVSYEYEVYGLTNDNWNETTITWNNSPNHEPGASAVTEVGKTAFLLGKITMSEKKVKQYTLDITQFAKTQTDGFVTLMLVDGKKQDGNTDLFSKDRSKDVEKPILIKY